MKTPEPPTRPTQRCGRSSQYRRTSPERTQSAEDRPALRSPRAEVAAIHATSPSPADPAPATTAVTARGRDSSTCHRCRRRHPRTHLTAGSSASSGSSLESGAQSLPDGGGTRGTECRGALNPLSSSPARRSALRGTPARPGLPSQSDGTPPPLAAAAASASFSGSSRRGRRRCDWCHLGSDGGGGGGDRCAQAPITSQAQPQGAGRGRVKVCGVLAPAAEQGGEGGRG